MIDILLATYNGEKFLREQLDSLLSQSVQDFRVLIRDDGSADGTAEIIEEYCALHPRKIYRVHSICFSRSAKSNFGELMKAADGDYIMFCDQDDLWLPDKISVTLNAMTSAEKLYGNRTPILVHTDLEIVGRKLEPLYPSFTRYENLRTDGLSLKNLLAQNSVTGCTVMFNRALLKLCRSVPEEALMHDHWLALLASAVGEIVYVDKPTVKYRQHGGNAVGAQRFGKKSDFRTSLKSSYHQAEKFLSRYGKLLSEEDYRAVERYAGFPQKSKLFRVKNILFGGFRKRGLIKILGQVFYC